MPIQVDNFPPETTKDLLDGAYQWILNHSSEPVPESQPATATMMYPYDPPPVKPYFTKELGLRYFPPDGTSYNILTMMTRTGVLDQLPPGPMEAADKLTWETLGDVVITLTTWMRLYGFKQVNFDAFIGDQQAGIGYVT